MNVLVFLLWEVDSFFLPTTTNIEGEIFSYLLQVKYFQVTCFEAIDC